MYLFPELGGLQVLRRDFGQHEHCVAARNGDMAILLHRLAFEELGLELPYGPRSATREAS
jgi:hypothetical protein